MCIPETDRILTRGVSLVFAGSSTVSSSSTPLSLSKLVDSTPGEAMINTSTLEHHQLLMRKGVYPYECMNSFDRFDETRLPDKEAFYSTLANATIDDEDYCHARRVWDVLHCRDLGDYHDYYLKTDVYLLADVFENFRKTAMATYELDPANYLTLPGLFFRCVMGCSECSKATSLFCGPSIIVLIVVIMLLIVL